MKESLLNTDKKAHQSNRNSNNVFFQPKLSINQPNDAYEHEADAVAEHVMRMDINKNENSFFKQVSINSIQRKCTECEEEEKLQRKENSGGEVEASNELESYVGNINSGGTALPKNVRSFFEPRFGYEFSAVNVHTDSIAAKSAQSINALAYTSENNIVFNRNQYSPNTNIGKKLLAHELTHVVQQNSENKLISLSRRKPFYLRQSFNQVIQKQTVPPSAVMPCPTSVNIGNLASFNHSNLSASDKEEWGTYIGVASQMNVSPGPDHTGHCMKERLTTISNNCPAQVYQRSGTTSQPCTGDKCLDINRYGSSGDGPTHSMVNDGPTSFIDLHRSRNPSSLLDGSGVSSCTVVCEQVYTCDRTQPTTGRFNITRNFVAGTHTRADGSVMNITTGTVTKTIVP